MSLFPKPSDRPPVRHDRTPLNGRPRRPAPEQGATPIEIPGAPENPYVERTDLRYDYAAAPTRCPVCERDAGGIPWGGWFTCELCPAIALVTGGVFVPVADEPDDDRRAEVVIAVVDGYLIVARSPNASDVTLRALPLVMLERLREAGLA